MRPTDIQRIGDELAIKWDDASETFVPLEKLRRACPCAGCKGEVDIMGNVYKSPDKPLRPPAFQLAGFTYVGTYAVQLLASISSGEPFTVENSFERSGAQVQVFGNQERPNLAPGGNSNPISGTTAGCGAIVNGKPTIPTSSLGTPDRWFDPCQFSLQSAGRFGNLGRDTLQGPNLVTVDLALKKNFAIGEKNKLEFRWETFNLLNHANFGVPAFTVFTNAAGAINPNAGKITTTRTQSRQMQLALKFVF